MPEIKTPKFSFTSPWIIGLFLFLIFLLTNGYKYGWDDQHLEIPMLKSLIDPTYFQGDYYVEALKKSFPSYFYRILSTIIKVDQIPATYFLLYLISRYFLFFWIYKLWYCISKNRFASICAVLTFILVVRVDEFLYRTFSHQEFVLPFIFAGFYYFFKERFSLASFLFGLGANIHGIYSLFPMLFMLTFLLLDIKKWKFRTLIKSGMIFTLSALPFIIFIVQNRLSREQSIHPNNEIDWLQLFITACPQNFLFPQAPTIPFEKLRENWNIFYILSQNYLSIILLFFVNLFINEQFRKDKKILSISFMAFILLFIWGFFTYVHPNRFVLDLNLGRNLQYLTFFLTGYLVLFLAQQIEKRPILIGLLLGVFFTFFKFAYAVFSYSLVIIFFIFLILNETKHERNWIRSVFITLYTVFIILASWQISHAFSHTEMRLNLWVNLTITFILLIINYFFLSLNKQTSSHIWQKRLFLIIPLLIYTIQYTVFHYQKITSEKHESGFWQYQRNWEDMQFFVKEHTDRDAMILTPYNMEMGGFRIFSDRKVVVCFRDIGLIGFDYSTAIEWTKRIHDIKAFQISVTEPLINSIQNAINKYNATYIVFMRYSKPTQDTSWLKHVYTNESFSLYKVIKF